MHSVIKIHLLISVQYFMTTNNPKWRDVLLTDNILIVYCELNKAELK